MADEPLPASFDWRNFNGHSYIGPVRDQGPDGTCYAFAACAAAESADNIQLKNYDHACADFAEMYIIWTLGQFSPYKDHYNRHWDGAGADYDFYQLWALTHDGPPEGATIFQGVCDESHFPYSPSSWAPPRELIEGSEAFPRVMFKSWGRVFPEDFANTTEQIKRAIIKNGVVCVAVWASDAFKAYAGGVYEDTYTTTYHTPYYYNHVNHAVTLVGWDDNPAEGGGGCWILRNSWGPNWGEDGYMRIRYFSASVNTSAAYIEPMSHGIRGTVSGDIHDGVTVTLSGEVDTSVTTDSAGNYAFHGLQPGEYSVSTSTAGYVSYPAKRDYTIVRNGWQGADFTYTREGTLYACGSNGMGQLGVLSEQPGKLTSPAIVHGMANVKSCAAGAYHSAAALSDMTAWAWGRNESGQLGDGTFTNQPLPTQVPGLANVVSVSCGSAFTLALKHDGTVWAWGSNTYGQLGQGGEVDEMGNLLPPANQPSATPRLVPGLPQIVEIAAGHEHSLALDSAGRVWGWGHNQFMQVGEPAILSVPSPQLITWTNVVWPGGMKHIAAGGFHSMAVVDFGLWPVFTWGANTAGQIGDGGVKPASEGGVNAHLVSMESDGVIAAGAYHSFDTTMTGHPNLWGSNLYGQMGTGTMGDLQPDPRFHPAMDVVAVAAGQAQSMAVDSAGGLFVWGENIQGQLGLGTDSDYVLAPTKITALRQVAKMACGEAHSLIYDTEPLPNLEVRFAASPSVYGSTNPAGDHIYAPGAVVDLVATPNAKRKFVAWAASPATNATFADPAAAMTTATISSGCTITAKFVASCSISGTASGALAAGVTIALSGGGGGATTTTGADGSYSFADLPSGDYTLTPSMPGYLFTPGSLSVTIAEDDVAGQDFSSQHLPATLTMAPPENGAVSPTGAFVVTRTLPTNILATPNTGYHFVGWTGSPAANVAFGDAHATATTATLSGDASVFAEFAVNVYTVKFVAGPNGAVAGEIIQSVPHGGATSAVEALPDFGYHFDTWNGGFVTTNPLTLTNVTSDLTITADFVLVPHHSADYDPADWQISVFELLRVVTLHNNGLYYKVDPAGPDGFSPVATQAPFAPETYHSADYNPQDGKIDVFELLRVVTLFNHGLYYKAGKAGVADGYAPSDTKP